MLCRKERVSTGVVTKVNTALLARRLGCDAFEMANSSFPRRRHSPQHGAKENGLTARTVVGLQWPCNTTRVINLLTQSTLLAWLHETYNSQDPLMDTLRPTTVAYAFLLVSVMEQTPRSAAKSVFVAITELNEINALSSSIFFHGSAKIVFLDRLLEPINVIFFTQPLLFFTLRICSLHYMKKKTLF